MHTCMHAPTHTCMHACMHPCMHTPMHTYTYVCMHACMHPPTHAPTHAHMHIHMHPHTHDHMHTCMYTPMHACTHAPMHVCTHTWMHACTHPPTHIHTHPCIHACTHASMHAHTHVHTHTRMCNVRDGWNQLGHCLTYCMMVWNLIAWKPKFMEPVLGDLQGRCLHTTLSVFWGVQASLLGSSGIEFLQLCRKSMANITLPISDRKWIVQAGIYEQQTFMWPHAFYV